MFSIERGKGMADDRARSTHIREPDGVNPAGRRGAARMAMRWPHARQTLFERLSGDRRLVDLCGAYETASTAADHWLKSNDDVASSRTVEYRRLMATLESDILVTLARLGDHGS
jgi:hypothetical protein